MTQLRAARVTIISGYPFLLLNLSLVIVHLSFVISSGAP